ncbi:MULTISPECIES: hypothetical protein [unclassified Sporosarcina]|nr:MULTISPECIES: hypothetical protein [unclassified Sporosarcina]
MALEREKRNGIAVTAALADGCAMSQTGRSPGGLITSPTAWKAPPFS